jgi:ankyrin repeat protein
MTTYRLIQQRLFDLCRNPTDSTNDELGLLKDVLLEINQEERLYLIDAEDETHRAPLFYAIESGKSLDFLRQLLEYDVRITNRILLCAIRYGNLDILKLLHQYGADFRQSYHGLSLLHECILLHKNHLISFLIEEGGVSKCSYLISYNFISKIDRSG